MSKIRLRSPRSASALLRRPLSLLQIALMASVLLAGGRPAHGALSFRPADVLLDWNALIMAAIRQDNTSPTISTRNLAILHIAIYDAVNAILGSHQPYQASLTPPPRETSIEAAAAAAAFTVMKNLYPSLQARSVELFNSWRATAAEDQGTSNGIQFGTYVAEQLLAVRTGDGSAHSVTYIPSALPGQWRRTPPFFRPPLSPQWRHVRPFGLQQVESFVPGPPPAMDSREYAESLEQVKRLGGRNTTVRTAEQSQIATFWSDFSYTAMPPGHWHEIAASIVRTRGTNLADSARLMALLSIAQADAAIICWETKYRYNFWRPITAIHRADEDGNDATEPDREWDHFLQSPPFPSYTSGHSTFSKASAEVLTHFYGTDNISFTATSDALPGVFRKFDSLSACADEVGMSRVYGGIHYPFDNEMGRKCGKEIAGFVFANYFLSNEQLPVARVEQLTTSNAVVRIHGHAGHRLVVQQTHAREPVGTNAFSPGGFLLVVNRVGGVVPDIQVKELPISP